MTKIIEVERKEYLDHLEGFRDNRNFIKVITGVRRCGKSTLMEQFMQRLKASGISDDLIFRWNLEDPENISVDDHEKLAKKVFEAVPRDKECYVFLDEVQRAKDWEKVVNALMSGTKADIYITGSNTHILSSELSSYLSGRYVSIHMLPLSFAEWMEFRGKDMDPSQGIRMYMTYGGFPSIDPDMGVNRTRQVLRDLYGSIVTWDISSRGQIRNTAELERMMTYLMFNVGNLVSVSDIVKTMGVSRELVDRYLDLMQKAYIIYKADRFDLSSTSLNPTPKYYSVDPGLRDMAIGFTQKDSGRVLENIVFLELVRRGYRAQVGKFGIKEVDFVAFSPEGGREYYQVCLSMLDEATEKREIGALESINDSFPKTVLTLDPVVRHVTERGIIVMYVVDWLLRRE
jgi:uncharacterized protein